MSVHLGNVAEFNEQFEVGCDSAILAEIREDCDVYSCISAFLTPSPRDVILAREVSDPRWWELLSARLGWNDLRIHTVTVGADQTLSDCAWENPSVRTLMRRSDEVVAWGESPSYRRLADSLAPTVAARSDTYDAFRAVESKSGAYEILRLVGLEHGQVAVPRSAVCGSAAEVATAIQRMGANGRRLVAKSNHGVAGYGTWFIDPAVAESPEKAILQHLAAQSHRFDNYPILIQEVVMSKTSTPADVTGDATICRNGNVTFGGAATMLVSNGHYGGAVTACDDMVDRKHWNRIREFTFDVGSVLRDRGYRGWFDIDFLIGVDDQLYALEINARRTGPVAAFTIAARAEELGIGTSVACIDACALPERLEAATVFEVFARADTALAGRLVPTSFLGLDATRPTLGLAAVGSNGVEALQFANEAVDEIQRQLLKERMER